MEIKSQILVARSRVSGAIRGGEIVSCALSGDMISGDFHIHHSGASFVEIAKRWADGIGVSGRQIQLDSNSGEGNLLRDRNQAKSWKNFHLFHAELVPVLPEPHLSYPKDKNSMDY